MNYYLLTISVVFPYKTKERSQSMTAALQFVIPPGIVYNYGV